MNLAISNLAWDPARDDEIPPLLSRYGFGGIEVAPTKIWRDLTAVSESDALAYRDRWEEKGIRIVAMQALLFGRDDLTIFDSQARRDEGIAYFETIFRLASWLGARALVYGSPRNRQGIEVTPEVQDIAVDYFRSLGKVAHRYGVCLCIEPLPSNYPCSFVTDSFQAVELTRQVNEPGFGLHLDSASLFANAEDLDAVYAAADGMVRHFHASEPRLAPVGADGPVPLEQYLASLRRSEYPNWVSIEMLSPGDQGTGLETVESALKYLSSLAGRPPE